MRHPESRLGNYSTMNYGTIIVTPKTLFTRSPCHQMYNTNKDNEITSVYVWGVG